MSLVTISLIIFLQKGNYATVDDSSEEYFMIAVFLIVIKGLVALR